MTKKFYIINPDKITKDSRNFDLRRERMLEVASHIVLRHKVGSIDRFLKTEEAQKLIARYWTWDRYCPGGTYLYQNIKVSHIKWYLSNKMEFPSQDGWNADFINGLILCGRLMTRKTKLPSFYWYSNVGLVDALRSSPFAGSLIKKPCTRNNENNWRNVPAFYLKYSDETVEYMAGAFSSGIVVEKDGLNYVKYTKKMIHDFKNWNVPIEHVDYNGSVWISPMWATLFAPYMPKILADKFVDIKKAANAELYAIVLWYAYSGLNFTPEAIPYLPSRRTVFYRFKSEDGALNGIEKMRIEKGLTALDFRIVKCIHKWKDNWKNNLEK